jgi:hypothetical protein
MPRGDHAKATDFCATSGRSIRDLCSTVAELVPITTDHLPLPMKKTQECGKEAKNQYVIRSQR